MSALIYIIRKSIKNSLKELLNKPGKMVMYLLLIAILVFTFVSTSLSGVNSDQAPLPMFWFTGILFAFVAILAASAVISGLSGGGAIFGMNDVNLLFVSPVDPRYVLLYGIVRLVRTVFLGCFFILFQAYNLARFGIDYGGVFLVFAGVMLSMTVLTVVSLMIYIVAGGGTGRKRLVKTAGVALFLPLAVYLAAEYLQTRDILTALANAINSPFLRFVPVAGWTASGAAALLTGEIQEGLLYWGLNLLLGAGLTTYIPFSNPDYYEDVLVAAETVYEKKRAISEGNIAAAVVTRGSVKINKTGIHGSGAAALFGKHVRESFRQNRFGFLTPRSMLTAAGVAVAAYFIRDLYVITPFLMWLQILLIGTGRGLRETYIHYIYLIPEPSFQKILWNNMEIMAQRCWKAS
jgi:hypothetical protein